MEHISHDRANGYVKYIDIPSFIDYFLVNEVSRNVDGNKKSSYWHKDRWDKGGKLIAGPVWDFDWAWKNIYDCEEFSHIDGSGWSYKIVDCEADVLSFGWFKRLLQDPNFANKINCRWLELRTTILDMKKLNGYIDSVESALSIPQQRHFTAFPVLGQNNGAPEVGATATSYHDEMAKLKGWIYTRIHWLDANMVGTCGTITAVENKVKKEIVAYPNPGNGSFIILNKGSVSSYVIFNAMGSILTEGTLHAGENIFHFSEAKGIYFLRTPEKVLKIVIQ